MNLYFCRSCLTSLSAKISVYVTGEVSDTQWTNTDFVTRELASHFTVHSDPPSPRFPGTVVHLIKSMLILN